MSRWSVWPVGCVLDIRSHSSNSNGPKRSLGKSSRATRDTWGRVVRRIYSRKFRSRGNRNVQASRHMVMW